jgi:hypothetical protein
MRLCRSSRQSVRFYGMLLPCSIFVVYLVPLSPNCIVSNDWMTVNDELKIMWKEVVVA